MADIILSKQLVGVVGRDLAPFDWEDTDTIPELL